MGWEGRCFGGKREFKSGSSGLFTITGGGNETKEKESVPERRV